MMLSPIHLVILQGRLRDFTWAIFTIFQRNHQGPEGTMLCTRSHKWSVIQPGQAPGCLTLSSVFCAQAYIPLSDFANCNHMIAHVCVSVT